MIGAVIGDLAAWTYEHDQSLFYKQLVADHGGDAQLSVYGRAVLNAASRNLLNCPWIHMDFDGTPFDGKRFFGQWLMWHIVAAWMDKKYPEGMPPFGHSEKEEGYARMFVTELIKSLRNGATKSEAYHSANSFKELSKTWKWKTSDSIESNGLLTCIFRAWDSFYRAFDFTSTIHNAVKWPGSRHLTAAIAGAFADAMYGCEIAYIKEKYAKGDTTYHYIRINMVGERYGYHHALIHEMSYWSFQSRTFYPKNCALTNVEWHSWIPITGITQTIFFSDSEYHRILLSKRTSFECRYGFYLDDGWVYLYRSHHLIGRFQLVRNGGNWIFSRPQISNVFLKTFSKSHSEAISEFRNAFNNSLYEGCGIRKSKDFTPFI